MRPIRIFPSLLRAGELFRPASSSGSGVGSAAASSAPSSPPRGRTWTAAVVVAREGGLALARAEDGCASSSRRSRRSCHAGVRPRGAPSIRIPPLAPPPPPLPPLPSPPPALHARVPAAAPRSARAAAAVVEGVAAARPGGVAQPLVELPHPLELLLPREAERRVGARHHLVDVLVIGDAALLGLVRRLRKQPLHISRRPTHSTSG